MNEKKNKSINWLTHIHDAGQRRPIECFKSQVIFRKRTTNYRALLRKITYTHKASYESSPLCICKHIHIYIKEVAWFMYEYMQFNVCMKTCNYIRIYLQEAALFARLIYISTHTRLIYIWTHTIQYAYINTYKKIHIYIQEAALFTYMQFNICACIYAIQYVCMYTCNSICLHV